MIRRTIASLKASLKTVLGIASPSLEFLAAARSAKCRPCTAPVPLPWYAARGPLEPYETPELAAADGHVGRLIRRHWWALLFEPEGSTAASVLEAMATPPERTGGLSWVEVVRQREALGMTPQLEPGYARVFHEQVFGRANRGAM